MSSFLKKWCFCFHSKSKQQSNSIHDEIPKPEEEKEKKEKTENNNPSSSTTTTTTTTTPRSVLEEEEEDLMEIYVNNGKEEIRNYKVPLRYLSHATFRAVMERSREDLNKIIGGQKISINSCEFDLFERCLKQAKSKEREAKCRESSYDERLWKRSSSLNADDHHQVSNGGRGALGSFLSGRIRY